MSIRSDGRLWVRHELHVVRSQQIGSPHGNALGFGRIFNIMMSLSVPNRKKTCLFLSGGGGPRREFRRRLLVLLVLGEHFPDGDGLFLPQLQFLILGFVPRIFLAPFPLLPIPVGMDVSFRLYCISVICILP